MTQPLENKGPLSLGIRIQRRLFKTRQDFHGLKTAAAYMFKRKPSRQTFFILCQPRSGSNLLFSYLNSVPGILCDNEILSPTELYGLRPPASKTRVLRHIQHSLNYRYSFVRGAKICIYQLDDLKLSLSEMAAFFPKSHWLVLYRKNILLQYLSLQVASKSNRWTAVTPPPKLTRVFFDPGDALRYRDQMRLRHQEIFNMPEMKDKAIWINYEALAENPQKIFDDKIFPVFKLPSVKVSTPYAKQNPFAVSEVIENYESVRAVIEKTDFNLELK